MAQYKVLQDIEAEDKLIGPLSLRQFIYAIITLSFGFVAFKLFMSPVWFIGFAFLPFIVFFGLLAAPFGKDQPSEVWLLAKIRFFVVPRKRIWDQSGVQNLVTITVPKKVEKVLTKGYTADEERSRLKALSMTLDTRGWAIKNVDPATYAGYNRPDSDRLFEVDTQTTITQEAAQTVDILDPTMNPRAQAMDQMINKAASEHREEIMAKMRENSAAQPQATQHEGKQQGVSSSMVQPVAQINISPQEEQALLSKIHQEQSRPNPNFGHLKTIQPLGAEPQQPTTHKSKQQMTPKPDPAILNLVENSEDLSVQTIAGQANRLKNNDGDEVVISLH